MKSMRDSALPRQVHELLGLLLNPGCLLVYLIQKITALLPREFRQVDLGSLNDRFNALDVSNALWNGLAIFIENSTQSVHQFRSLADNPLAHPEQNRACGAISLNSCPTLTKSRVNNGRYRRLP